MPRFPMSRAGARASALAHESLPQHQPCEQHVLCVLACCGSAGCQALQLIRQLVLAKIGLGCREAQAASLQLLRDQCKATAALLSPFTQALGALRQSSACVRMLSAA